MKYDRKKLRELMLYIAGKSTQDPLFGSIRLNKVLFYADFLAFATLGDAITGCTYVKLENGPAPNELPSERRAMDRDKDAIIAASNRYGLTQRRLIARRNANLKLFSADEIALVDHVIEAMRDQTATEISDFSHEDSIGWQLAEMKEEIPYSTTFISPLGPSVAMKGRVRSLAAEYGW